MTDRDRDLDHGDEPITLEEILESIERDPVNIRVRIGRELSWVVVHHPDLGRPDGRRPRRLLDVSDWT